jgi:hypothetical protein
MLECYTGRDDFDWAHMAQDMVQCEHGNEVSGSIEGEDLIDQLSDY